ncbi:MAG: sugar phosphate isomerase/epimerase family protein [Bryobacteraceae bacterium]|jgi:sugar phosphate isomerase/epimerase
MPVLRDLRVGVFYWIGEDAEATVREISELGVEVCQLAVVGERELTPELAAAYRKALATAGLEVATIFAAYEGESYADILTVMRTVGFMPPATRATREVRTREVIDFGAALGIRSFGCHIGFVPEERNADYEDVREVVRRISDYAASHGMTFFLETGQEPAPLLLQFLKDVARPNVRINFDPANMVLYGSGEPIEAFRMLRPHVVSIHGKDGDWPDPARPGALGTERPLGAGAVNIPKFVRTVRESGYTGTINVESGVHGDEPHHVTLRTAVEMLKRLRDS